VLIGYMRVSKADGSQVLDLQRDALLAAGVTNGRLAVEMIAPALPPAPRHFARATRSLSGNWTGSAVTCAIWSTWSMT
jgi:hypothetical protein